MSSVRSGEMLEKNVKYLRDENERLKQDKPTMPVIPKAVAYRPSSVRVWCMVRAEFAMSLTTQAK